jgi:hypothetical protein
MVIKPTNVIKHTRAKRRKKSINLVKLNPRVVFLQGIPLRDFIMLMFYEWGQYKQYMNHYRPQNTPEDINQELEKMLEDKILSKGKNDNGKEINILKVPDGFDALDEVLNKWPIYAQTSCVELVKNASLKVLIQKLGIRQED